MEGEAAGGADLPYIAFDLDAFEDAETAARRASSTADAIMAGLLRLWRHCWRTKTDSIPHGDLAGFFAGSTDDDRLRLALERSGFLDLGEKSDRVRGAERYLRVSEARSRGGHAAKGNLKKGTRKAAVSVPSTSPAAPRLTPGSSRRPAGAEPGTFSGSAPALTASSEHSNSEVTTTYVAAELSPIAVVAPDKPPLTWLGEDFWQWAQWKRQEVGFVAERRRPDSRKLSSWYSSALGTLGGDVAVLQEAFYRFGEDKHWQGSTPPLPFAGFMSQWDRYAPRRPDA